MNPPTPTIPLALVLALLAFPPRIAASRSSPLRKSPTEEVCCFVGSAGCARERPRKARSRTRTQASSLSEIEPLERGMDSSGCEFDLQKARLMARFSSVAYEDPPNAKGAVADGVERYEDDYGVSIARPIPRNSNQPERTALHRKEGAEDHAWDMAHSEATVPRPLMLMLSDCNADGMSEADQISLERARFRWVALASNQNTSAQFDAWRISSADEVDESDAALVIAFRGTRLTTYVDFLTDIQLKQEMIGCSDFGLCMGGKEGSLGDSNDSGDSSTLMAHSGFLRAYTSIRPSLLQFLSDNAGTYNRIWFTGHSLGGGMATLAVVDVGSIMSGDSRSVTVKPTISSASETPPDRELNIPKVKLSSYLFGTPRVGNRAFADRLARLQRRPQPIVQEYYRVNTSGDAVVFLPRGKVVNRLDLDYVHAGASVFLPALPPGDEEKDDGANGSGQRMAQLEEDTIERINRRILADSSNGASTTAQQANAKGSAATAPSTNGDGRLSKIRIFLEGDRPPDPLSEVDPGYAGFFPMDPRTWTSPDFLNFILGETVRSFRVLRGGFVRNHGLATYEDGLCLASQDDVLVVDSSSRQT